MMKFKDTFYDKKVRYFCISIALLLLGVAAFFIFGFHGDLNVRGGSIVTYPYTGTIEMKDVQLTLNEALENPVNLRTSVSTNDENRLIVSVPGVNLSEEQAKKAADLLQEKFSDQFSLDEVDLNVQHVSSNLNIDLYVRIGIMAAATALVFVLFGVLRFRKMKGWAMGLIAFFTVLHDAALLLAVSLLVRLYISTGFLAAILATIAYSTFNVFSWLHELYAQNKLQGSLPSKETLSQSMQTHLPKSLQIFFISAAALIIFLVGGLVTDHFVLIRFIIPMVIGLALSTYSVPCIAGSLYLSLCGKEAKVKQTTGKPKTANSSGKKAKKK